MHLLRLHITLLFCLLQVLSPLLHAHVGEDCSPTLIHLPGLEGSRAADGHDAVPGDGILVCTAKGVRPWTPVFPPDPAAIPLRVATAAPGASLRTLPHPPPATAFHNRIATPLPPSRAPPQGA